MMVKRSYSASPNLLLDRLDLCCAKGRKPVSLKLLSLLFVALYVLYDQAVIVQFVSPFLEFCCIYNTVAC